MKSKQAKPINTDQKFTLMTKKETIRASKGSVTIDAFQGRLRLRLPRQLFDGKQKYISLGLDDTPSNHRIAESKAALIERDILYEQFDYSLDSYKLKSNRNASDPQTDRSDPPHDSSLSFSQIEVKPELIDLWNQFTEFKSRTIEQTTILTTYRQVKNHIISFPTQSINESEIMIRFLNESVSANTAKRTLMMINACCDWAVQNKLINVNPFAGTASRIRNVNRNVTEIDPFTVEERDAIINAFESNPYFNYFTPFVKFLFFTGCRTGEAIALQWKHIDLKDGIILLEESVCKALNIRKDTKTHKARRFPINDQLKEILNNVKRIKSDQFDPNELVFKTKQNHMIDPHNFNQRAWKGSVNRHGEFRPGIVTQLVDQGLVTRYRPQYNTRHTFITMAIEAGIPPNTVAKWVGNSTEVIVKHYLGTIKQISVPEF